MSLTKAQRVRRTRVLRALRDAWTHRDPNGRPVPVELTLQRGRKRPRVRGIVGYVATSDAFVILADDDWPEDADGAPASILRVTNTARSLHVPVDVILSVRPAGDAAARARVRRSRR